jgi:predicted TPR repeat methyltransferase
MIKSKSLIKGIGNYTETSRYYNKWSTTYDKNLLEWEYKAPKKASLIIKSYLNFEPKNILDLACGTGLFAEKIIKIYPKVKIDGMDISKKILLQAKNKNIYRKLICKNFDKIFLLNQKYELISCIGAMTYTKNPKKLILQINKITKTKGYFIFTHRVDLWKKENYSSLLKDLSNKWESIYISKPILYLPKHSDFNNKVKIKIALLKKC